MEGYLGETPVDISKSEFKNYTPADWAMYFIERYGQIDGGWHQTWVLDQVARILKGTPVIVNLAQWRDSDDPDGGIKYSEYRVTTGELSLEYLDWALGMLGEFKDGDYEYSYDMGIAP
jgi:hypothetical protein